MKPLHQDEDPFVREIRRQAERAQVSQRLTFWQGLGLIGSVGWMVAVPTLIGAFLGRWIDARAGSGISWTLSLLLVGLVVGCASAWRHVGEGLHK
jgi:ATP synthase protein I